MGTIFWDSSILKLRILNLELNHEMSEIKGAVEATQVNLPILQMETLGPA